MKTIHKFLSIRAMIVMIFIVVNISIMSMFVLATGLGIENNYVDNSGFERTEVGGNGVGNFLTLKPSKTQGTAGEWLAQSTINGTVGVVSDESYTGNKSLKFTSSVDNPNVKARFYCQFSGLNPMPYSVYSSLPAGVKTRVDFKIKTENVQGTVGDWFNPGLLVDALVLNSSWGDGYHEWTSIAGTSDWKNVSIELVLPENKSILELSFVLKGKGTAWIDDIKWYIPVTGITVASNEFMMNTGTSTAISAIVTPASAGDKSIIWSSSNPTVATINQSGIVNCISQGTSVITATTTDGNKKAYCIVNPSNSLVVMNMEYMNESDVPITFLGSLKLIKARAMLKNNTTSNQIAKLILVRLRNGLFDTVEIIQNDAIINGAIVSLEKQMTVPNDGATYKFKAILMDDGSALIPLKAILGLN